MKRKAWLAILLSVVMAVTFVPTMAFAVEGSDEADTDAVVETELVDEEEPDAAVESATPIEQDVVKAAAISPGQYDTMYENILNKHFYSQEFFYYDDDGMYEGDIYEDECAGIPIRDVFARLQLFITYNDENYTAEFSDLHIDEESGFEFRIKNFPFDQVKPGEKCTVLMNMDGQSWSYVVEKKKLDVSYKYKTAWTGKTIKPTVTVKCNGETLTKGTDYTIVYYSGKSIGSYGFEIDFLGDYKDYIPSLDEHPYYEDEASEEGGAWFWYEITPKGKEIAKLSRGKGTITVKWKKQSAKMPKSRITGYQVQVATDSKFTKNKKSAKIKGYKHTSKKIKKLKRKTKYYVRVRTYKSVSGGAIYSSWSTVKTIKTR